MYLSHPVRRMRETPRAGETARLVVDLEAGADRSAFESAVGELDGTVESDLRFATAAVELPEPAVADLCELPGIDRVETARTLGPGTGDAGEDC